MSAKPHMNLVVIGHVDHGKSTTMGHFLYKMGAIDERTLKTYEEEAKKIGKESFKYAWVLDRVKEERERGLTIDLAFQKFETRKYYFTLIDAPGHRDFVKNMITGASQADAAIMVVSAKKGEAEVGIAPGGQTREHAYLSFVLGIRQIIVLINKMDDSSVNWAKARYEEVKQMASDLLKTIGYNIAKINFIPVSGWLGDNLTEKSSNMPWYNGPTLLEALDMLEEPPKPIDKPLRIPIQGVYSIKGVGVVPVGRVEQGVLKPGDIVAIYPGGLKAEVKSIEMHHQSLQQAIPGDNIGFNLKGVEKNQLSRGMVVTKPDTPIPVAKEFIGQIYVIYHPTAIAVGYTPVLHIHTAQTAVKFVELIQKMDPRTGQITEKNPSFLKTGDVAVVRLRPLNPVAIEPASVSPELGRFAIRDSGMTVAAGVVKEITETA
ncbi:elongation factor EF-1 alpha subunit [Candidatus Caldarchaeum subterraneum]|uniref:Elongation factor 1-alpha n=1 Tax=Caldiarchaeum subterraneum TaxID=311458 RepID=E6N552_CALS0|nr:elongation factor EF-1 alpha subunit [Candidatus Caldarchaeum subterraneum]BAJ49261.1 elongation factor EF-1 alpha subunit [Candidatus Caldarchaeum subterraneum]BAJ50249.1 elongation factor EF-1 alpha subunit [Candidatus Caldarchaeum subterraneum]